MNCPFCQQWNVAGTVRCVFCDNRLDSTEDTTGHGRPMYQVTSGSTSLSRLPHVEPDQPGLTLPFSPRTLGYLAGGALVLLYLLAKLMGC